MSDSQEQRKVHRPKKNPLFLVAALVCIIGVILTYTYEFELSTMYFNREVHFAVSVLELLFVVMTLYFMRCYLSPKLGKKLTGLDLIDEATGDIAQVYKDYTPEARFYTRVFKVQSGKDEKIINSSRKKVRSTRKHYAAVTREMQDEEKSEDSSKE